jgi:pimeloyl-ACP methyl ester carboxylesterase
MEGHNPWVNEQCFQSVKKVYEFLGAGENVGVLTRMGQHYVSARDIERCIDYLDIKFKGKDIPWESELYFNYSWSTWAENHPADRTEARNIHPVRLDQEYNSIAAYEAQKPVILDHLNWLLGVEPPGVKPLAARTTGQRDWMDLVTGRPVVTGATVQYLGTGGLSGYASPGDFLRGILYCPEDHSANNHPGPDDKIPAVIFLHQYAYSAHRGFSHVGGRKYDSLFQTFIDKGIAVLLTDMFGFGNRLKEGMYFYHRYPEWSKMGKMVLDVKACADALESLDHIDGNRIFLLGYSIGGSVALMAAAQDERIAGTAVVSAFSPWRTSNDRYESLRTYSHMHGFLPRLGFFAGDPQDVPVDFREIISCISPRPLMIISPALDRYADQDAVEHTMKGVENLYRLYGKPGNLVFQTPLEIHRMSMNMYRDIARFYSGILETK